MKINEFFVDQPAKSCLRRLELRKEKVLGDVQISRLFFYTANVIPAAGSTVVATAAALPCRRPPCLAAKFGRYCCQQSGVLEELSYYLQLAYVEAFQKTFVCDSAHCFNPGFLLPDSLLGKASSKAELVQVIHTPIICLRNLNIKRLEIKETKSTFIIKTFKVFYEVASFIRIPTFFNNKTFSGKYSECGKNIYLLAHTWFQCQKFGLMNFSAVLSGATLVRVPQHSCPRKAAQAEWPQISNF